MSGNLATQSQLLQIFSSSEPPGGITPASLQSFVVSTPALFANVGQLRNFTGTPGLQANLQGKVFPGDGLQGVFYWQVGSYTDDGLNIIVPSGASGAWIRSTPGGATNSPGILGSISLLRSNSSSLISSLQYIQGYYTSGDGGEGFFWRNTADTTSTDNGGTIIIDGSGIRWYREFSGRLQQNNSAPRETAPQTIRLPCKIS